MGAFPSLSPFAALPDSFTRKLSRSSPGKGRLKLRALKKILQRLGRQFFRDEQLAGPPFKSLTAEVDFNTWGRKVMSVHEKMTKRIFVLKTVDVKPSLSCQPI
jgi:hypothetical protein